MWRGSPVGLRGDFTGWRAHRSTVASGGTRAALLRAPVAITLLHTSPPNAGSQVV